MSCVFIIFIIIGRFRIDVAAKRTYTKKSLDWNIHVFTFCAIIDRFSLADGYPRKNVWKTNVLSATMHESHCATNALRGKLLPRNWNAPCPQTVLHICVNLRHRQKPALCGPRNCTRHPMPIAVDSYPWNSVLFMHCRANDGSKFTAVRRSAASVIINRCHKDQAAGDTER